MENSSLKEVPLKNISLAKFLLRYGLIFVFGYAIIRDLMNPADWMGYVPNWVTYFGLTKYFIVTANRLLESVLILMLVFNYKTKWPL